MNLVKKLFLGLFISSLLAPAFYAYSPTLDYADPGTCTGTSGASSSSDNDEIGGPIPG